MKTHTIEASMLIPRSREQVFPFFCDVVNLQRITPPELDFRILTSLPVEINKGTQVDYQLKLFGIAFNWRSEITVWDPPNRFVDAQISGPYKLWEHTHLFYENDGGTLIDDQVKYRLPFWPFGEIAYPVVRAQLKRIFNYRQQKIRESLNE